MMSFVHEDMYRVFRDPYKVLKAAGLKPGQEALEVGCGPGFFTIPAAGLWARRAESMPSISTL